jgi:hypothetical protein
MIATPPPQILPSNQPGTAAANRELARLTDALALRVSLTPRYLQHLNAESLLSVRRSVFDFSLGQAEAALSALQRVNTIIEHARHRYGNYDLPSILETVTKSARQEIRLLATREAVQPGRHSLYVYQSSVLTVALQTWDPGKWTAWHDHSCDRISLQVVEGYVREMRYESGRTETFTRTVGGIYTGDPTVPHRVGDGNGISLHAYSPELEWMTLYRETDSGSLALAQGMPIPVDRWKQSSLLRLA